MNDELKSWKGRAVAAISENAPLRKGDIIIIRFKWFLGSGTYLKSAQLAIIDEKLANRSDFAIRSYVDRGEYLDCEIEVLASPAADAADAVDPDSGITQASFVVTGAVAVTSLSIAIIIASLCFSLLRHEYYMLVKKGVLPPPGQSSFREVAGSLHVLAYVAGVLVVLYVFRNLLDNRRGRSARNNRNSY